MDIAAEIFQIDGSTLNWKNQRAAMLTLKSLSLWRLKNKLLALKSKELESTLQKQIHLAELKYRGRSGRGRNRFLSNLIVQSQGILNEFSHIKESFGLAVNEVETDDTVFDLRSTILNTIEIISMGMSNQDMLIKLCTDSCLPEEVKGDL